MQKIKLSTGKWNRLSNYKTSVLSINGGVQVTYHRTRIVDAIPSTVILDTDGWKGATTKKKMNQASHQFDLGYTIHQHKGEWYVTTKAGRFPFVADSFQFDRATGIPFGASFPQLALAAIGKLEHEDCY